jgi:hypothetical protein
MSAPPSWPAASRVALPHDRTYLLLTGLLLFMGGCAAAATALFDLKLGIPGNSILRPILPYMLGLALVPRRGAGTTMTGGSILTLLALNSLGFHKGLGGTVSLILLGPALDLALLQARPNWILYIRFALAGLVANGLAFAAQVAAKSYGLSLGGGKDARTWLSIATISYPLFGLVAGLLGGLLWFHWSPRQATYKSDSKTTTDQGQSNQ